MYMPSIFSSLDNFFKKTLWEVREDSTAKIRNLLVVLRLLYKIGQEFLNGEITRRASSLVFTTLLTLVPVLAVSFAVLKAFGVHNMLGPFLSNFLEPLGEKGDRLAFAIIRYVNRINVGFLGTIGLASLVYTVTNTVQQVESAFNYLWQIKEKRSLLERFRDYMSVLLVGPVLIFSALGITTSIMSNAIVQKITSVEPFGTALFLLGKILPYFLISAAFTLMYYLLPYTKVKWKSALVGGVSAGILWEAGSWAFAHLIVTSMKYSAIYSGFAIILLFMIWLYYNWLILLTGSKISFYHQFPVLLRIRDDRMVYSEWYIQRLAIILMYLIGYNYFYGKPRWTLPALMERLQIPKAAVQDILEGLENKGLILRVDTDKTFVPSRDIETIRLSEIVNSIRGDFQGAHSPLKDFAALPGIEKIMGEMENSINDILSKETLKELITSHMHDIKRQEIDP
jgi:membrane protein